MRSVVALALFLIGVSISSQKLVGLEPSDLEVRYQKVSSQILNLALSSDTGFDRLAYLCDQFGPRLSGSSQLEEAIDWVLEIMQDDGLGSVHGEAVMVPHWVRGEESVTLLEPRVRDCPMLGLGGSVGTPKQGLTAEVIVVRDFDELKAREADVKGKIVLFNAPFTEYGKTVVFRSRGAVEAAKLGAVASLIRSVGPFSMQTPHTGAMGYDDEVVKIPHAAITAEDADMMQRMQERGNRISVRLRMEAETKADAPSRNVVAELTGSEFPGEIVLVSGHIDSWDVGQGAMDDGGGCLAAWEAVRLLKQLGLQPRRTIRVVLWTNEENGMAGVKTYRKRHANTLRDHVLAMESDTGVFEPQGFSFTGSEKAMPYFESIVKLLKPLGEMRMSWGAGVSDIMYLLQEGVPVMGVDVNREKYFWYHHTAADTMDKLSRDEFNRCVAAYAVMAYVVADMPDRLPR